MKFSIIVLLAFVIVAATHRHSSSGAKGLLEELEMELAEAGTLHLPMSRVRRVPAPGDIRACGRKLVLFVLSVCGESCSGSTSVDIATACCSSQCSDTEIKEACCPLKLK